MKLVYVREGERLLFPLGEGESVIGRKACELAFPHPSVSRWHARIVRRGSRVAITDLESRNGTLVNGKAVTRAELVPGDVIQIGKIVLELEGAEPSSASHARHVPDQRDLSEIPSDDDLRVEGGEPKRSDSFRDFDDFDSKAPKKEPARTESPPRTTNRVESRLEPAERAVAVGGGPSAPGPVTAAAPAGTTARVVVVLGEPANGVFTFDGAAPAKIGSKPENTIAITGEGVSRFHAEIKREGDRWLLADLGSKNGIFFGGKRVESQELKAGDLFQVGTVGLRFELIETAPPLPRDLKLLLKDERVRKAFAVLVVLVLLVMIVFPGGEPPPAPTPDEGYRAAIDRVVADLRAEPPKLEIAKVRSGKLVTRFPGKSAPPLLDAAIEIWAVRDRPLSFPWEKAKQSFEALKRDAAAELGPSGVAWIDACLGDVDKNLPAWQKLKEGEQAHEAARAARDNARDCALATEAFGRALTAFSAIAKDSALARSAEGSAREVRVALEGLLRAEINTRLDEAESAADYEAAEKLVGDALKHSDDPKQSDALYALRDLCQINAAAVKLYGNAHDLASRRDPNDYSAARRMLESIDPRARIYPHAIRLRAWMSADLKSRQARDEYNLMCIKTALGLLGEVRKELDTSNKEAIALVEQLRTEAERNEQEAPNEALKARASKRRLKLGQECDGFEKEMRTHLAKLADQRARWQNVSSTYSAAVAAHDVDDFAKAEALFKKVTELEPRKENGYQKRAKQKLQFLTSDARKKREENLETGLKALKEGPPDWDKAYDCFVEVLKVLKVSASEREKETEIRSTIAKAVAGASRAGGWLKVAKDGYSHDEIDKLPRLRDLTRLLTRFLPEGDEQVAAHELNLKISERIKSWEKSMGMLKKGEKDEDGEKGADGRGPGDDGAPGDAPPK